MSTNYPAKRTYSTPIVNTALSEFKLRLNTDVPDSKRKSTFAVNVIRNQIHLVVYTNIEGDQNKGAVRGALDALTFYAVLSALADIIDGVKNEEGKYPSYRIPVKKIKQGGTYGDLVIGSWIHLAREDDGRIYIALTDGVVTSVKFYFAPTDFHTGWLYNGKPIDVGQLSGHYASAWGSVMDRLGAAVLALNYVEPEKPVTPGSQSASNNDSSSSTGWGGSSNDDIPI